MISSFSQTYAEARRKFQSALTAAGGAVESLPHPLPRPDGGETALDVGFIGDPDATLVLVLACGVHGPEGFYGSAAMTHLLQTGLLAEAGTRTVLLHACNPYGFAHLHRFTEDNTDLNRNFWGAGQAFGDDAAYRSVQAWAEIAGLSEEAIQEADRVGEELVERIGVDGMKIAVGGGQGCSPSGLFFRGAGYTWSRLAVERAFAKALAGADATIFLDLHTGLGPRGAASLLHDYAAGSRQQGLIDGYLADSVLNREPDGATDQELGHTTNFGFERAAEAAGAGTIGMTIECGTLDLKEVIDAIRLRQALFNHGGPDHPRHAEISRRIRDAFYVDADDWKTSVVEQTVGVVRGSLKCLKDGAV